MIWKPQNEIGRQLSLSFCVRAVSTTLPASPFEPEGLIGYSSALANNWRQRKKFHSVLTTNKSRLFRTLFPQGLKIKTFKLHIRYCGIEREWKTRPWGWLELCHDDEGPVWEVIRPLQVNASCRLRETCRLWSRTVSRLYGLLVKKSTSEALKLILNEETPQWWPLTHVWVRWLMQTGAECGWILTSWMYFVALGGSSFGTDPIQLHLQLIYLCVRNTVKVEEQKHKRKWRKPPSPPNRAKSVRERAQHQQRLLRSWHYRVFKTKAEISADLPRHCQASCQVWWLERRISFHPSDRFRRAQTAVDLGQKVHGHHLWCRDPAGHHPQGSDPCWSHHPFNKTLSIHQTWRTWARYFLNNLFLMRFNAWLGP